MSSLLAFLESIGPYGYGGMVSYEIALAEARQVSSLIRERDEAMAALAISHKWMAPAYGVIKNTSDPMKPTWEREMAQVERALLSNGEA